MPMSKPHESGPNHIVILSEMARVACDSRYAVEGPHTRPKRRQAQRGVPTTHTEQLVLRELLAKSLLGIGAGEVPRLRRTVRKRTVLLRSG